MAKTTITTLAIRSRAFQHERPIPFKYTCDGDNVSPQLEWSVGPEGTQCYGLICDDPDAPHGTFTHWVAWNIRGTTLPEGMSQQERRQRPELLHQGRNSWGQNGYGGPCPPSGTHRYFFRVYALDSDLPLSDTTDAHALERAMRGHVLAEGTLMGTYARGS